MPSVGSLLTKSSVTTAEGCEASTTVNVAVAPCSVVGPEIALTKMPALSLSVLVSCKLGGVRTPYAESAVFV